jgi:hypothetical protein
MYGVSIVSGPDGEPMAEMQAAATMVRRESSTKPWDGTLENTTTIKQIHQLADTLGAPPPVVINKLLDTLQVSLSDKDSGQIKIEGNSSGLRTFTPKEFVQFLWWHKKQIVSALEAAPVEVKNEF